MSLKAMIWALDLEVPSREKLVAVTLGDYADKEGYCWPGYGELSERASISEGSARRAIKCLVEWGLIEATKRFHPDGKQRSNLYLLRLDRTPPVEVVNEVRGVRGTQQTPPTEAAEKTPTDADSYDDGARQGYPLDTPNFSSAGSHPDTPEGVTQTPPIRNSQKETSPLSPPGEPGRAAAEQAASAAPIEPASPGSEAQGSAGKANEPGDGDGRDDPEQIAREFDQLETIWQQERASNFAGDRKQNWKAFRVLPFEKRRKTIATAPNYIRGCKAAYARWQNAPRTERSQRPPKIATIREFIALEMFETLGMPNNPPPPVVSAPPPEGWVRAIEHATTTRFDPGVKVFVESRSAAMAEWVSAFRRARLPPFGVRNERFDEEMKPGAFIHRHGRWFRTEWPPAERDFQEQKQERGAA